MGELGTRPGHGGGGQGSARWIDFAVWPIALFASLANLLNFNGYPLFRPEIAIALAGLAVIGGLMGAVLSAARPRLAFLVAALFLAIMIDLNTSFALGWFYAIWAGLAVAGFFALDALLKIALAAFATVLVFQASALVLPGPGPDTEVRALRLERAAAPRAPGARPAIVHVLLDSHLGLGGMDLGPRGYADLGAELAAFYGAEGFQVYPRAYSRHSRTSDSLPRMFSYGEDGPGIDWVNSSHAVPGRLPYFADLKARGYRVSAAGPKYFDLCARQELARCRSWQSSELTSLLGADMAVGDRARIIGFTMLQLTDAPARLASGLQFAANDLLGMQGRWTYNRSQLYHLASLGNFDRFIGDLADLQQGEVRFAHFLLPHSPFGLRADCSVKPEADWINEHGPAPVAERERAYADQVRCVTDRIARMLAQLDRSEAGRGAIVLIHGDHGSRIAPHHPSLDDPDLSPREMLMSHSTLFALRVPGEPAETVMTTVSLDELLSDFRARDFRSAPRPRPRPAEVIVTDSFRPGSERQPLPAFGP